LKRAAPDGYSLAEFLIAVAVLAVLAGVAIPLLSTGTPQALEAAAEEAATVLRFALSEARRTGGYVLVDGKSNAGHLKLYHSDSNAGQVSEVVDPLTKRATDFNVDAGSFAPGITLTPEFIAGGGSRPQLLIGPGSLTGYDTPTSFGAIQSGSGILLSTGTQSRRVAINETTGRVSLP